MDKKRIKVLLIEDDPDDVFIMKKLLSEGAAVSWDDLSLSSLQFELTHAGCLKEGVQRLSQGGIDVVLLDLNLPDSQGLESFKAVQSSNPSVPIVVLTGLADGESALVAVRSGAQDYLSKGGMDGNLIFRSIRYAIERKRLQRLQEEFISIASHEIRSPLGIVKGVLENLRDGIPGGLSGKQGEVMEMANRNIDLLERIVRSLLDLSRLESGKTAATLRPLDLLPLIRDVIRGYRLEAEKRKVVLKEDLPPVLSRVSANPDMMTQLLNNLLSNALRFAKGQVVVQACEIDKKIRLSVVDDGPGIPREDRERIFEKFEQVHRPPGGSGYKGTGLGLAICREIVRQHGGEIRVEGDVGTGARFHCLLPASPQV